MTREVIENEIRHRNLMLQFTRRVIQDPPVDRLSIDMLAQAERIQSEIVELFNMLKGLPDKKVNKKQALKKKTKKKGRSK